LKVAFGAALTFTLPLLLREALLFALPGLSRKERRYVVPLTILSFLLLLGGALFAYFFLLPIGLRFLIGFGLQEIKPMLSIENYVGFASIMLLATGLAFQLPLVLFFLASLGLVDPVKLREWRKYALLISFIAGGVLTPSTDMFTQSLLAGALYFLYEISLLVIKLARKANSPTASLGEEEGPLMQPAISRTKVRSGRNTLR
ncbi:MAG TPA: twin-arginine translocase subunit TatC, partial [Chroococcales cyanobacterium]